MSGPGSHSPVGASSIKRGILCSLSVDLSVGIEDEESEHAALGTAVHSVIEECFRRNIDAWQLVGGKTCEDFPITKKMANDGQVMLSKVRQAHPDRHQGNFWVERRFHCPTIHPLFFGTADVIYLEEIVIHTPGQADVVIWVLHVWDYKNGFKTVEHVENEQCMYYAAGALEDLDLWDRVSKVVLHVVQPNGFHWDGPVREWETTPGHIAEWLEDVCLPGIERTTGTGPKTAVSGDHCTFCPARSHACPALMADMDELEVLMAEIEKTGADALSPEQLTRILHLKSISKIVFDAAESTAFKRLSGGSRVAGWKLAKARAWRKFKESQDIAQPDGSVLTVPVADAARAEFGDAAFTEVELLSPAKLEDLPLGSHFTARWAYKPDTGLTLTKDSDSRPEVSRDTKSLFSPVAKGEVAVPSMVIPMPASGGRRKPATAAA